MDNGEVEMPVCDVYVVFGKNELWCHDAIPRDKAEELVKKYIKNAATCTAIRVAKYNVDADFADVYWWNRERGWSKNVRQQTQFINYATKQVMRALYGKKVKLRSN